MLNIPVLRWGRPYTSLEVDNVIHFSTGETLARVSQANPGLLAKDIRQTQRARDVLCEIPIRELIRMMQKAADLYRDATLPMGDGVQSPDDFARQQSASTGLPEHMCKANMTKNHFVLSNMDRILDCLTRGLDLEILSRGYGVESRGVIVSYQAQSPVLGLVLPSNSPGVHTLWLPVVPMQIGLVLKPGPQEPWTPYRMAAAFCEAGVPREAISIYPGAGEMGAEVVNRVRRTKIFGSTETVQRYEGNPRVHPGKDQRGRGRRHDGEVWSAVGRARAMRVSSPVGDPLPGARRADRQHRIHVPVCHSRSVSAGADD